MHTICTIPQESDDMTDPPYPVSLPGQLNFMDQEVFKQEIRAIRPSNFEQCAMEIKTTEAFCISSGKIYDLPEFKIKAVVKKQTLQQQTSYWRSHMHGERHASILIRFHSPVYQIVKPEVFVF